MECPNCKTSFHPQMWNFPIGLNKENKQAYVYYQICPNCKDAIVGIKTPKEGSFICYPNDTGRFNSTAQIDSRGSLPYN